MLAAIVIAAPARAQSEASLVLSALPVAGASLVVKAVEVTVEDAPAGSPDGPLPASG